MILVTLCAPQIHFTMQQEDSYGTQDINFQPLKSSATTKLHELIHPMSNINALPMNMKKSMLQHVVIYSCALHSMVITANLCVNNTNKLVIIF
jgi:hypothetical protein